MEDAERLTEEKRLRNTQVLTNDFSINKENFDASMKNIFKQRAVLCRLLKEFVEEYRELSLEEINQLIEPETLVSPEEIRKGADNKIHGITNEYSNGVDKASIYDIRFLSVNPKDRGGKTMTFLHISVEPQKDAAPEYKVEYRGFYYLAGQIREQLTPNKDRKAYDRLEKAVSIWICVDNVPKDEEFTYTIYGNAIKETSRETRIPEDLYDMQALIIIKLGRTWPKRVTGGKSGIFGLLYALSHLGDKKAESVIGQELDLSNEIAFRKEIEAMESLYERTIERGIEQGIECGIERGIERGIAKGREEGKIRGMAELCCDFGLEAAAAKEKIRVKCPEADGKLIDEIIQEVYQ